MKKSDFWTLQTVGERLKYLRIRQNMTQEEVAEKMNISRSVLVRLEKGEQDMRHRDIVKYSKLYSVSCDTLLCGIRSKYYKVNQVTGLQQRSIDWLQKINKQTPELLKMVNIVLSDENIAEPLFEIFYIYAALKFPSMLQEEDGSMVGRVSLALSDEETLLKSVMTDYLHDILVEIRAKYDDERFTQTESKAMLAIKKLEMAIKEKQKDNRERKESLLEEVEEI